MADRDEIFEHELEEKLKRLDAQIKIPEIPDAQTVFERAEKERKKTNVIPFKKYSRYVAAAAAVVLICVAIPALGSSMLKADSTNEASYVYDENEAPQSAEEEAVCEEPESESFDKKTTESFTPNQSAAASESYGQYDDPQGSLNSVNSKLRGALEVYFSASKEFDSAEKTDSDDLRTIEEYLNKKRSIEITIEDGSVSVLLQSNDKEPEIINAFWVEGVYKSSYFDENELCYVITVENKVGPKEFENGYFLPMVGDYANGTYNIPESAVSVPDKVELGIITLTVKIDIATGEYKITGELK